MKNFYMSITDYSEIRFLTGDITDREDPDKMLTDKGIITAKGNPSKSEMRKITEQMAEPLIVKVHTFNKGCEALAFEQDNPRGAPVLQIA